MVSFVESATLRINDQSTSSLKKITAAVKNLQRAAASLQKMSGKAFNLRANVSQIDRAVTRLNRLNAAMAKTGRQRIAPQINDASLRRLSSQLNRIDRQIRRINSQTVGPKGGNVSGGNGSGAGARGGSRYSTFSRFPRNIMPILGLSAGYDVAMGVRTAARAAGSATLATQAEISSQQILGFTPEEMERLGQAASEATRGMLNLTNTQALASARNLKTAGVTDDALTTLTRAAAQGEAALTSMFGADTARRITESNIKIADLAGVLDDAQRGSSLLRAGTAAQLRGGEDFNFKTFLAAVRTSGQAMSLTEEALVNFASAVDEQGRAAGAGLQRFVKVLSTPQSMAGAGGGVAKGTVRALIESGLRTSTGAVDEQLMRQDFGAWIRKYVVPALEKRSPGIDLNNDAAVQSQLAQMGFVGQERRLVSAEVVKRREREYDRAQAKRIQIDNITDIASRDMGLALQQVSAQFKDVSAKVLEPIYKRLAPLVSGTAQAFDDLEHGVVNARTILAAGAGVAGAGVAYAAANPHIVGLGIAAATLTRAGVALNVAAGRLALGGGVGGVGGAAAGGLAGAIGRGLMGATIVLGTVALTAGVLNIADPKGNMWGLTDRIDEWVKKNLGFNPSDTTFGELDSSTRTGSEQIKSFWRNLLGIKGATEGDLPASDSAKQIAEINRKIDDTRRSLNLYGSNPETRAAAEKTIADLLTQRGALERDSNKPIPVVPVGAEGAPIPGNKPLSSSGNIPVPGSSIADRAEAMNAGPQIDLVSRMSNMLNNFTGGVPIPTARDDAVAAIEAQKQAAAMVIETTTNQQGSSFVATATEGVSGLADQAAKTLLNTGGPLGAAIAAAINANISIPPVNVNVNTGPDTGNNTNAAR